MFFLSFYVSIMFFLCYLFYETFYLMNNSFFCCHADQDSPAEEILYLSGTFQVK